MKSNLEAVVRSGSPPKERRRANQTDGAERHRVLDEIRVGHESDADEHRRPGVHPLAIDEADEADAAEEEVGK